MPINVSTVYDRERILRLNNYFAHSKFVFWIVMGIASLLVMASFTLLAILDTLSFQIWACLISVIFIDILYLFSYLVLPLIALNKNKSLNVKITYSFDTDSFQLNAVNEHMNENMTAKYTMLIKVVKENTDLYMFISNRQAYVVDLSGLSEEQIEMLKETMEKHIRPNKIKWKR